LATKKPVLKGFGGRSGTGEAALLPLAEAIDGGWAAAMANKLEIN